MKNRKIELDGNGVTITATDGSGIVSTIRDNTRRRIEAMILDDLGISYEAGIYGPEITRRASDHCVDCGSDLSPRGNCEDDCHGSRVRAAA